MTKHIRIENADTSNWNVDIEIWDTVLVEGLTIPKLVEIIKLDHPTQLHTAYITGSRYLVIKEAGSGKRPLV